MNRLERFLDAEVENREDGFILKIREVLKIFNKSVKPCQRESEFVNHFVAASKSGNDWIRIA